MTSAKINTGCPELIVTETTFVNPLREVDNEENLLLLLSIKIVIELWLQGKIQTVTWKEWNYT